MVWLARGLVQTPERLEAVQQWSAVFVTVVGAALQETRGTVQVMQPGICLAAKRLFRGFPKIGTPSPMGDPSGGGSFFWNQQGGLSAAQF